MKFFYEWALLFHFTIYDKSNLHIKIDTICYLQQTAAYSWLQPHRLHHQDINIRLTHIDAYSFPLLLKSVLGAIQCMIDLRYRDVHNISSSMMLKHVANLSIGVSIIVYRLNDFRLIKYSLLINIQLEFAINFIMEKWWK